MLVKYWEGSSPRAQFRPGQLGSQDDAGQNIVKVVCNASGQDAK